MKIISLSSQKGGVGKTTSTVNLAACLATHWRKKVLVIDLDPQSAATVSFGFEPDEQKNIWHVLNGKQSLSDILLNTAIPDVTLVPADIELSDAENILPSRARWDRILPVALTTITDRFDFCLIDSPPSLGVLSQSALISADICLIPMQCQFLSLRALTQFMRVIQMTVEYVKPEGVDFLIVRTMYDGRTKESKQVSDAIQQIAGDRLLSSLIHQAAALQGATSQQKNVFLTASNSRAASEYRSLTKEMLDYVGNGNR